jgi:hypothetical protein
MTILEQLQALPTGQRIIAILALMVLLHLVVRGIRALGEWILAPH